MPATFTVDGFAGAGIALNPVVFNNISKFEFDTDKSLLKMTDINGEVTNISCSDIATFVVTVAAFRVTTVVIAN